MKILTIDIETGPHLAHVWQLWQQNVSLSQLRQAGEVLSFAAKWYGSGEVFFYSTFHDSKQEMLEAAYELLSGADIVVHYNGERFDIPHLNREFLESGYDPPAPYQQLDLLKVIRRQFKFASNKLDYVVQALGLGAKESHTGHQLWVDCLAGDDEAWELMKKYNIGDVVIEEKLYDRLKPWIPNHPSAGLYTGDAEVCPGCGGTDLRPRGYTYTALSAFRRFRCEDCGKWSRGTARQSAVTLRGI